MRVRPDGLELLRAARATIDATIEPCIARDRLETLHGVTRAIALAEDRLARDAGASAAELAVLESARATMRGELLEASPERSRYEVRLVAKAIGVAAGQLANGRASERKEYERLAALFGIATVTGANPGDVRDLVSSLNERLGARIRAGEFDAGTTMHEATLAHLAAVTDEALLESNPTHRRRSSRVSRSGSASAALGGASESRAHASAPPRVGSWVHLSGVLSEAVYGSGTAALTRQTDLLGCLTQRLAACPHVPMLAVESAHQAHDVSLAIADVSTSFLRLMLAPFRRVERHGADSMRVL
ncbi:MAG: hypothetical protein NVSMB21_00150 [Vulcanimicrobiaceae bacterium]